MKASEAKLLEFLRKSPQFVIPIYQRAYSWTERECRQLWNDILRAGRNEAISAHFIGSIVYIQKDLFHITEASLLVIDGQQRLTTVMLILEALARRLDESEHVEGSSPEKIRHYYLLNPLEQGDYHFKLVLTQTDKESLLRLLQQRPEPPEKSLRISANFAFFESRIKALGGDLSPLWRGLLKLMIVDIALSRDQDNPQLIFESMNSTGRELSQADLIRNYVLMGLEPIQQERLYKDYWRPMEVAFGQEAYDQYFDSFMRHYLTFRTGTIPKIRAVYDAFKEYSKSVPVQESGVENLIKDLHAFAGYYCAMALGQEPDKNLDLAFGDLRALKVDVAYPFLLEMYHDYAHGRLTKDDFVQAARMVEAYVFRRAVCEIATNSLNKTFATFGHALEKDDYLISIRKHFLTMPSYRRFPSDDEFKRKLTTRDLYNFPRRSYWLRRMENHDRKECAVDEYTIEHILPQNEDLALDWQQALGPNWREVQEKWLHTLGNLTLTGYNSEYGDRPFHEKRDMEGGFKDSPLRLNRELRSVHVWNEDAIKRRAEHLAQMAVKVWTRPAPQTTTVGASSSRKQHSARYTLAEHRHLDAGGPMLALFNRFREQVLALNPCVSEEILQQWIAYKAETNFVDVIPQKSRLRLTLNLPFHELTDSRKLARDVSSVGHWGNGDVAVHFSMPEELPYIMGLVRQAFEKQMGNGETYA